MNVVGHIFLIIVETRLLMDMNVSNDLYEMRASDNYNGISLVRYQLIIFLLIKSKEVYFLIKYFSNQNTLKFTRVSLPFDVFFSFQNHHPYNIPVCREAFFPGRDGAVHHLLGQAK